MSWPALYLLGGLLCAALIGLASYYAPIHCFSVGGNASLHVCISKADADTMAHNMGLK